MRAAIPASILLGLIWNVIAICLMGGKVADAFRPGWLIWVILYGPEGGAAGATES